MCAEATGGGCINSVEIMGMSHIILVNMAPPIRGGAGVTWLQLEPTTQMHILYVTTCPCSRNAEEDFLWCCSLSQVQTRSEGYWFEFSPARQKISDTHSQQKKDTKLGNRNKQGALVRNSARPAGRHKHVEEASYFIATQSGPCCQMGGL